MTRRDHLDRGLAEGMETVLADLADGVRRDSTPASGRTKRRVQLIVAFAIALALIVPATLLALSSQPHRSVPAATEVPVHVSETEATIGALPQRRSLLLRGTAALTPLDEVTKSELRSVAENSNEDPEVVLRDYATEPAFDDVMRIVETAPGFADAVYHRGRTAASELRFVERPSDELLDTLRRRYPGDLRIEWGEVLTGERDRNALSTTVSGIVHGVPGVEGVVTGVDGDGRLTADFGGTASMRTVVDALLGSAALRALYVDGRPPTEIRVRKGAVPTVTFQ